MLVMGQTLRWENESLYNRSLINERTIMNVVPVLDLAIVNVGMERSFLVALE